MTPIGFDPQGMTDQELLDKMMEIHKRLAWAGKFSACPHLVEQLRNMANACSFAQTERTQQRAFEAMNKNRPDEVELVQKKNTVVKTNGASSRASATRESGFRITRTTTPPPTTNKD